MKSLILFLFIFSSNATEEFVFKGKIEIDKKNTSTSFELHSKDKKRYYVELKPKGAENSCFFRVSKITAPQQLRGRGGVVFANRPKKCEFKIKDKELHKFWNSLVLLDMGYRLKEDSSLMGDASFRSVKKGFQAKVTFDK